MIGKGKSFGAITIVSAIASGKGCALGIDMPLEVEIELERGELEKKSFVDFCIQEVFSHFNVSWKSRVKIDSKIPQARGLKSSSAVANAVIIATLDALGESVGEEEILKMNVEASRKAGVSITGALDDAAACLWGGLTFTDNRRDVILKREKFEEDLKCILYIPEKVSYTRDLLLTLENIKKYSDVVDSIFSLAYEGCICEAMTLNGLVYSPVLGFPVQRIMEAIGAGARSCSLSGTGSAFAALVPQNRMKDVADAWGNRTMIVDIRRG